MVRPTTSPLASSLTGRRRTLATVGRVRSPSFGSVAPRAARMTSSSAPSGNDTAPPASPQGPSSDLPPRPSQDKLYCLAVAFYHQIGLLFAVASHLQFGQLFCYRTRGKVRYSTGPPRTSPTPSTASVLCDHNRLGRFCAPFLLSTRSFPLMDFFHWTLFCVFTSSLPFYCTFAFPPPPA